MCCGATDFTSNSLFQVFGEAEFLEYQQALNELADVVKAYSSTTSLDQQHQSAAKDLTGSPVRGTPSTIQVTYLPSTGQRSKRPKHFLELKSFKDNYNTLESTLWERLLLQAENVCMVCWACVYVRFKLSLKHTSSPYSTFR